jgi:O-antigen ligase
VKLHQFFFSLLVILLPVQLARHFWPDFSLVSGIRIDYLSPTLYLTDILMIGILGAWFLENRSTLYAIYHMLKHHWWIIAVFCFLLLNAFLAQNQGAAFYELVKIVEFSLLGFYVARNNYTPYAIRYTLSIAIIYSSLLAFAQLIKQGSLNGVFWFLGERTFNVSTPGIARAVFEGQLIMRPYATFPHPNVLAGFILVSLILIATGRKQQATNKIFKRLVIGLGAAAIVLSFSRAAWLVGLIIGIWYMVYGIWKRKKEKFLITFFVISFSVFAFFGTVIKLPIDEAISYRLQLNKIALEMVRQKPLIGVGLNNFIPQLPHYWLSPESVRFLQPVHNIFLLVCAETGLVGLLIFLWFLILTFKRLLRTNNLLLLLCLSAILALGLFDHYWLTLQQTQLLFTIILGLSWVKD